MVCFILSSLVCMVPIKWKHQKPGKRWYFKGSLICLYQIALGIVLHRWQRNRHQHFHWEQPQKSLMFKLSFLQEIFAYCHMVECDMCVAGDLKDPLNHQPIKKGMMVISTSRKIYDLLHQQTCLGNHEHQVIEGTPVVHGCRVNRSQYTEDYPQEFACQK